jgi:hypothetical protein
MKQYYRGPECSNNLNAPTIVISPSWRVVAVLIFVIFSSTEITSNGKSVTYEMIGLEERSPKMLSNSFRKYTPDR